MSGHKQQFAEAVSQSGMEAVRGVYLQLDWSSVKFLFTYNSTIITRDSKTTCSTTCSNL